MVQTAVYDPVVVEPQLTSDKVRELVQRQTESAKLDYKAAYDPSDARAKAELAKDIIAMANTAGGYIVIGVANDTQLLGLTDADAERIDESVIRSQIAGYVNVPIGTFVHNSVRHEGTRLCIITVLPLESRLAVVEAQGQYSVGSNRSHAFRRGDVLVRHGSKSETWNQADADFLARRISLAQKEQWRQEFAADLRAVVAIVRGEPPPVGPQSFDLPPEEFLQLSLQLLRGSHG
jgi:hypothetical protein